MPINFAETAQALGVNIADVNSLIAGTATGNSAGRLDVTPADIDGFIRCDPTHGIARRIGISIAAAEDLGRALGREGRIGFILGLLLHP